MGKNKKISVYYKHAGGAVPFPIMVIKSDKFSQLSSHAKVLLLEMQRVEFPSKNGKVVFSVSMASKFLNVTENTASKAMHELINAGFITMSYEYEFINGKAREWIITYLPLNGKEPTHEWRL